MTTNKFNTLLSLLDLVDTSTQERINLRKLFDSRQAVIDDLKGVLHERDSRITALEYKLNEVAPPPVRTPESR